MSSAVTWANLSTQSTPNWPAAAVVLALHAALVWGMWQVPHQPVQDLELGTPLMVRFIQAPPAPKPVVAPEVKKPVPEPEPEPKPEPRVERPPEPVKPPEPEKKPLIAQTRPKPVPMETAPPPPKPKPLPEVQPKPAPPVERAPPPPRSAPAAETAEEAPVIPPNVVAAYQNNPPPVYPMRSRRLGEEGQVLLRVHITPGGYVDQVTVQRSCGHERLDSAALEAVREWRFSPARKGDRPVAAWVLVPIQFELS